MDCGAEERLVRIALQARPGVHRLQADLQARQLLVFHEGEAEDVAAHARSAGLGARVLETGPAAEDGPGAAPAGAGEARALGVVLAINAGMFAAEAVAGLLADSSALLADSLDMLADAAVYGIALAGARRTRAAQSRAAHASGVLQALLALGVLAGVVRRVFLGSAPEAPGMALVALAALAANLTSMWWLSAHRDGGAHMKASWIFTTNDVIANLAVIVAAGLVWALESNIPDLAAGAVIGGLVLGGAVRILRLKG